MRTYYGNGASVYIGQWIANCINDYYGTTKATYASGAVKVNNCLGFTTETTLTPAYATSQLSSAQISLSIDEDKKFLCVIVGNNRTQGYITNRLILCVFEYDNAVYVFDNNQNNYKTAPFNMNNGSIQYTNVLYIENTWTAPSKVYLTKVLIGQAVLPDWLYTGNFYAIMGQQITSSDGVNTYTCIGDNLFLKNED